MSDVLRQTSEDYQRRIDSFDRKIATQQESIDRLKKERVETVSAKEILDKEIAKLPPQPKVTEKAAPPAAPGK